MTLPIFPTLPGITWPITRSALWSTIRQESISGLETRLQQWSYPRYKYQMPLEVLRAAAAWQEMQALEAFFNSVGGSAQVFYYSDPGDNAVTAQGIGLGNGSTTAFQLVRSLGGFTVPVFAPAAASIYVAGVLQGTGVSVNSATGQVTFTAAPAAGAPLTWTGTFYWPCRFDDDQIDFDEFMFQLWSVKSLKFSTVKL